MQAIVTRYLPPLDSQECGMIKASCQAETIFIDYDEQSDGMTGAHDRAALALVFALGWDATCYPSRLVRAGMPDGSGYVYVFAWLRDEAYCYDAPETDCIKTRA